MATDRPRRYRGQFTVEKMSMLSVDWVQDAAFMPLLSWDRCKLCSAHLCSGVGLSAACIPLPIIRHHFGTSKSLEVQDLLVSWQTDDTFSSTVLITWGFWFKSGLDHRCQYKSAGPRWAKPDAGPAQLGYNVVEMDPPVTSVSWHECLLFYVFFSPELEAC